MLFLVLLLLLALALLAWYYLLEQLKNPSLRKQLLQKNLYERPSLLAHSWLKSETSGTIREKHPLPKLRRSLKKVKILSLKRFRSKRPQKLCQVKQTKKRWARPRFWPPTRKALSTWLLTRIALPLLVLTGLILLCKSLWLGLMG